MKKQFVYSNNTLIFEVLIKTKTSKQKMMNNQIAIHESATSDKVEKFVALSSFTPVFQEAYENNLIDGCYVNEAGEIVARTIHNDIISDVVVKL